MPDNSIKGVIESVPQVFLDLISRLVPGYLAIILFQYLIQNSYSIRAAIHSINEFQWPVVLGASWALGLILDAGLDWRPHKPGDINRTISICKKIDSYEKDNPSKAAIMVKMLAEKTFLRSLIILAFLSLIFPVIKNWPILGRSIVLYTLVIILLISAWFRIRYHIQERFMKG
jgi:hypothetical protein